MAAPDGWTAFRDLLERRCRRHSPKLDSFLYNGGTVAVLLATALATFLPTGFDPGWVPRALTGFAAFWIGLERALSFGARWRYHLEMQAGYENLIGRLDLFAATRDEMTPAELQRWREEMANEVAMLQGREADVPGSAPELPSA